MKRRDIYKLMNNIRKIIPWLLVILWMALIFYLSHQPVEGSNKLSTDITKVIIEIAEKTNPNRDFNLSQLNHIVRKNAHFFFYLVLGVLVANGLRTSEIRGYRAIGITSLICVIYAISDEVHQLFIPGRGGQAKDVIIDIAGAVVGILGYNVFVKGLNNYYKRCKQI